MIRILVLMCVLLAQVCPAAGVDGKWSAETPSRDGGTETTVFELKADGTKLTGVVRLPGREDEIREGELKDGALSFVILIDMGGREMRLKHTGTLAGDGIRFVRELEGLGRRAEFTARRAP